MPSKRLPKIPLAKYPRLIEKQYTRYIKGVVADARRESIKFIKEDLVKLNLDSVVLDAAYVDKLKDKFQKKTRRYTSEALKFALRVNRWQKKEHNKQVEVIGVDPVRSEPWLEEEIRIFTESNVELIKNVPDSLFDQLESKIISTVRSGGSTKDLIKFIFEKGSVSISRAEFIAVDQINKFNGALTRLRQEDLGIKEYIWQTSIDDKVRPEHRVLNNTKQKWSDPPVTDEKGGKNHPGGDYRCRCSAIPVFEGIV